MKEALNAIIGFFKDLGNIGNYIYKFSTDDEIARLRVFLVWFIVALTDLGLAGYVLDDLLLGAIILILEGVYSVADGALEAPSVYKLKPVELPNFAATNVKEAFEEVDRSDVW